MTSQPVIAESYNNNNKCYLARVISSAQNAAINEGPGKNKNKINIYIYLTIIL